MKGVIVYDVITKSLIFGTRNFDKVTNAAIHDEGRIFATTGQFANAVKAVATLDNKVCKASSAAINAVAKVTEGSRALNTVAKGVNWAANNVNPLLIGAAGYRVLVSDNKIKTLNREVFGMSAMFGVEALMKRGFQTAAWTKLLSKIPGAQNKIVAGIIQGLIFVAGSIAASTVGAKVGDKVNSAIEAQASKNINLNIAKTPADAPQTDDYDKDFFMVSQNKELIA